ncbi:glycosyltransferase family 2 protein [Arcticibacter eurypsychrophilus]|uniref:glycosyltransferase family 2 protein n=1 Tax=Arcticibacter eurypsychrophilus TaxID=1434752 RepID=UPI00084DB154|nr:glycosyltransferase family 2 protein [Arcticibacter eurypsychrophilus]
MNSILVIIVTYNSMEWIDRCMESLYNSSIGNDIFIVDNKSSDETITHLKANHKFSHLVESEVNLGFGRANNLGLKYALDQGYEYIYLLNQDAWIFESTFDDLIRTHKKYKQFGILSPMQLNAGSKKLDDNFLLCCPKKMLSDLYFNEVKDVYETEFVMAAHWLIGRECLQKVGGFSASFPHYGEDHNFLHRANYFEYRTGIVPSASAIHDRGLRVESNKVTIEKLYLEAIAEVSNTNKNLILALFKQPLKLVILGIKIRSKDCIFNSLRLIIRFPVLISNRNKSKLSAFLG